MANSVPNATKGCGIQLFKNVDNGSPANSRIILVPLEASGLEAHSVLKDYDNLAALLAGANNEQTTMGRKTIDGSGITVVIDDVNDLAKAIVADQTYTSASGNGVGAILLCYDEDNTSGTDSDVQIISIHDFAVTPAGDVTMDFDGTNGALQSVEPA